MPLSKPLSEEIFTFTSLAKRLAEFDNSLGDSSGPALRLKAAVEKGGKIPTRQIQNFLDIVNRDAVEIIEQGVKSLAVIGQQLTIILNDYKRTPHSLIVNWNDLEKACNRSLGQWLSTVNSQITSFLQILRIFLEDDRDTF
jgi:hypothetical protein